MSKTRLAALVLLVATLAFTVHVVYAAWPDDPWPEEWKQYPHTGLYYSVWNKTTEEPDDWGVTDDPWVIEAIQEYERTIRAGETYNGYRHVWVDQEETTFFDYHWEHPHEWVQYNMSYYKICADFIDCFEGWEELQGELTGGGFILGTGWIILGVATYHKRRSTRD
jgi:hypothetical protein